MLCKNCLNAGHSEAYCPRRDDPEGQSVEFKKNLSIIHQIRTQLRENKQNKANSSNPSLGAIDLFCDSNGNTRPNDGNYVLSVVKTDGAVRTEWVKKSE